MDTYTGVEQKKKLPLGQDDFRKIREQDKYYVDKTMMIKDFIDNADEGALITRPRRFGKTLNMTMLRDFFDVTQDSRNIFDGLYIMDTTYAQKINSTPTIFLTFRGSTGMNMIDLLKSIASEIRREYAKYEVIFEKVDRTTDIYMLYFDVLAMLRSNVLDNELLKNSLAYLIEALRTYYGVRPIVLIDEYDNPIIEAHQRNFRTDFTSIYGAFLTMALKGNPHLGQALLTGIQRVAKESIFSKLNHIVVYNVLSENYSSYFGLTKDEVAELLDYYDLEFCDDVKAYYDGYLFADVGIYNPWSIIGYAKENILKSYWVNTSTNVLIQESLLEAKFDFHRSFEKLIQDGEVTVRLNLEAAFTELPKTDTLWGLFVNAGYLTVTNANYKRNRFTVRIPNEEIRTEFEELVSVYTKLSNDMLHDMLSALLDGQMDEFFNIYQDLVIQSTSYYDAKENAYHMLMLGMVMNLRDIYIITSNIEAGLGRSDILMKSRDSRRPHIIIEFKQGEDIEKLKQEALSQIMDKKYYSVLKGDVLCVGLAHDKKICQMVSEMITV